MKHLELVAALHPDKRTRAYLYLLYVEATGNLKAIIHLLFCNLFYNKNNELKNREKIWDTDKKPFLIEIYFCVYNLVR